MRFDRAKRPDLGDTLKKLRATRVSKTPSFEEEIARWKAFFSRVSGKAN